MASSSTVMLFKSDTFLGGHGCMDHLLVYLIVQWLPVLRTFVTGMNEYLERKHCCIY